MSIDISPQLSVPSLRVCYIEFSHRVKRQMLSSFLTHGASRYNFGRLDRTLSASRDIGSSPRNRLTRLPLDKIRVLCPAPPTVFAVLSLSKQTSSIIASRTFRLCSRCSELLLKADTSSEIAPKIGVVAGCSCWEDWPKIKSRRFISRQFQL